MLVKLFFVVSFSIIISSTVLAANFVDNGDGTVTDRDTSLMWQQTDDDSSYNWSQALHYCNTLSLAGYENWRLPNIKELLSIANYSGVYPYPAIDNNFFYNTKSEWYWSSTSNVFDPVRAWAVIFSTSWWVDYSDKIYVSYVRCVRGN